MTQFNLNSPIKCLYQIPEGEFEIRDLTISPDCQIITSTDGVRVKLWNLHTGKLLRELVNLAEGICLALAISPDGKTIAGACQEYSVGVWDLHTGEYLKTLNYSTEFLHHFKSVAFFPDNVTLIAGGLIITNIWDIRTEKRLHEQVIGAGKHLALSPNGDHLMGSSLSSVEMTKMPRTGDVYKEKLSAVVGAVAISRDGQVCVAGLFDGTIKFWQWETYAELHTIKAHSKIIKSIAFSSDGQTLLSGSRDKSIKFWNVKTGELQRTISKNLGEVIRMVLSADNRTLIIYDSQKTIKVWQFG
jgi:WD40 repeat protein